MRQSAVEWLFDQLLNMPDDKLDCYIVLRQAKEMERENIIKAYNTSFLLRDKPYSTAEKYYNETYIENRDTQ
jgi:hypothetical protein